MGRIRSRGRFGWLLLWEGLCEAFGWVEGMFLSLLLGRFDREALAGGTGGGIVGKSSLMLDRCGCVWGDERVGWRTTGMECLYVFSAIYHPLS